MPTGVLGEICFVHGASSTDHIVVLSFGGYFSSRFGASPSGAQLAASRNWADALGRQRNSRNLHCIRYRKALFCAGHLRRCAAVPSGLLSLVSNHR